MKSLRKVIEKVLDEQFCISLRYQEFHSEGTLDALKSQATDAILRAVREAMPEEMKTPKQGYSGFNSCCEYAEERSWNSYRTALLGILEEGAE